MSHANNKNYDTMLSQCPCYHQGMKTAHISSSPCREALHFEKQKTGFINKDIADYISIMRKILSDEAELWEKVREEWMHLTLDAGAICKDHDIWTGVPWLYDLQDYPLKELHIIDNPDQFMTKFEQFAADETQSFKDRYVLSLYASIPTFWDLMRQSKFDNPLRYLAYALMEIRYCYEGTRGRARNVRRGIEQQMTVEGKRLFFVCDSLLTSHDKLVLCDFFCRCGLIKNDDLARYMHFLAGGCFLSLLSYNYAVVCRRPAYIKTPGNRLHCDDGPAIEWADGSKWYYLNNIRVPEEVITSPPDDFDADIILQTKNAEVRKEIIQKIGIEKLIGKLNGQLLDRWHGYELIKLPLPDMQIVPVYLKMVNPSTGSVHIEGVPPEITSCKEALSWRVGGMEWNPEQLT